LWERLITDDPDVVLAVLSHAFQNSSAAGQLIFLFGDASVHRRGHTCR
jgi:hypothetical protein